MKPLLSPKDTTALLGIGSRKLWELTNCAEIPHLRIGRAIRYDPDDLEAWVAARKKLAQRGEAGRSRSARPSTSREQVGDQGTGGHEGEVG